MRRELEFTKAGVGGSTIMKPANLAQAEAAEREEQRKQTQMAQMAQSIRNQIAGSTYAGAVGALLGKGQHPTEQELVNLTLAALRAGEVFFQSVVLKDAEDANSSTT